MTITHTVRYPVYAISGGKLVCTPAELIFVAVEKPNSKGPKVTIESREEMPTRRIEIDLDGPQGDALHLIMAAKKLCEQLEKDPAPILKEMKSGNYDNLIEVFEREFGEYVTLYR